LYHRRERSFSGECCTNSTHFAAGSHPDRSSANNRSPSPVGGPLSGVFYEEAEAHLDSNFIQNISNRRPSPAHGRDRYPGRESGAMLGSSRNFAHSCGGRWFERMSSRMTRNRLRVLRSPTRQIGPAALVIAGIRKGITSIVGSGKGTLRIGIRFHFRIEWTP